MYCREFRTRSSSSRFGRGKSRFGKRVCTSPEPHALRKPDTRLATHPVGSTSHSRFLLARLEATPDSTAAPRKIRLLIRRADVNLQVIVADAANDIGTECVAAEFSSGVSVHETNFAARPTQ